MPLPVVGKPSGEEPGGDFTWFIYGSSLDAASLEAWSREHGYAPPDLGRGKPARLAGWRLSFDVVSRHWGGAVASIEEASGDWVEGLAVPMPASARGLVDHRLLHELRALHAVQRGARLAYKHGRATSPCRLRRP